MRIRPRASGGWEGTGSERSRASLVAWCCYRRRRLGTASAGEVSPPLTAFPSPANLVVMVWASLSTLRGRGASRCLLKRLANCAAAGQGRRHPSQRLGGSGPSPLSAGASLSPCLVCLTQPGSSLAIRRAAGRQAGRRVSSSSASVDTPLSALPLPPRRLQVLS